MAGIGERRGGRTGAGRAFSGSANSPGGVRVRYHLYEKGKQWEPAAETAQLLCQVLPETPFGWIHLAYALHELKRTREAYDVLIPVVDRFPEDYVMP